MVGHYLAEFSISYKPVKHGKPGIGATHSSRFIPLKVRCMRSRNVLSSALRFLLRVRGPEAYRGASKQACVRLLIAPASPTHCRAVSALCGSSSSVAALRACASLVWMASACACAA